VTATEPPVQTVKDNEIKNESRSDNDIDNASKDKHDNELPRKQKKIHKPKKERFAILAVQLKDLLKI
jgi:hypothetical protein